MVLDKRVDLKDLEAVDYELYKGLTWMLCVLIVVIVVVVVAYASFRHRVKDITGAQEETFSVMQDRFGEHVVVELRPGGDTPDLTEANKEQLRQSRRRALDRRADCGVVLGVHGRARGRAAARPSTHV